VRDILERNVFRWEGEYWTIVFDGQTIRVRDGRGIRHLAALIARPWDHVPAVELHVPTIPTSPKRQPPTPEKARIAVTKAIKAAIDRIAVVHASLGEHFATTIRRGYLCRYVPDRRYPIHWEQ